MYLVVIPNSYDVSGQLHYSFLLIEKFGLNLRCKDLPVIQWFGLRCKDLSISHFDFQLCQDFLK